ncbi:pro-thyrotropin-releasing hormone-like [Lytechinus variegatus]|uniref:pro-thyrotropin-releasing hormone-like n=1 Tax=Lytechinus variegatus TaxID=7654 RepID=UPI001BB28CC2|nr:pro-thyrotropin-releasing hormone-like [Lytechinus variegatus]
MKGTVGLYLWACILGYVTWGGAALPTVLGKDLVAENDEPELADWVQGNELPLRSQYWDEVGQVEEEGELDIMSPESNKRQYPGGKRQYPGGKRQYPGGKRQYPAGKRQYPAGKRQFVGGELIPSPELRQWPGGKRQWPGGKRQWPGGKRQWPGGKRQWPGGKRQWPEVKRQYPGGKRSESDQDLLTMELRQYPGGKRQWPGGKRQYPAGKRQYPGGKRQFPGGKRQFLGGEPLEQESNINKRFAPEDDTMDLVRLSQLYGTNNDVVTDERELALEDLLDEIMVDTRPEIDDSRDILLGNLDQDDALALDLSALLAGW